MGTPVITPQQVRDVSFSGFFVDPPFTDALIQGCIDVCTLWYGASYLETLTGTPNAIKYSVAHVIWIQYQWEKSGLGAITGANKRNLVGVGSRGYAFAAFTPADFQQWWDMPGPFKVKLSGILAGLPPGGTTTGAL